MSITEKLASRDIVRLERIHASLKAKDWPNGSMYDEQQGVTMEKWAELVKHEIIKRRGRMVRSTR